ncbi:MAG: acetyl-CoA carboxylase biotin carboxyl carrier protein [Myxococcota bacterium]|nr:acetyl-CoA carboxylase biotin carboxyl carrier protein [Myxococcota bacterium]
MKDIKAVLGLLEDSDIQEFEYKDETLKIRVRRGPVAADAPTLVAAPGMVMPAGAAPLSSVAPSAPVAADSGHTITSPFVGTFYRSPSPDSPPFTEVGQRVEKGQTLCIVEAMKLMNEIEADASGTVKRILVENEQPVEFGQALFAIQPD